MSGGTFPRTRGFFERGVFSALDWHFANTVARLAGESRELVVLAAALASRQVLHGHVCLDLRLVAGGAVVDEDGEAVEGARWPELDAWRDALSHSPLVSGPTDRAPTTPLILDACDRLYLARYWAYERRLAAAVAARAREASLPVDAAVLADGLNRMFPENGTPLEEPDWQKVAAIVAVQRRFSVISGGPGTGKTHTVVKILALLIEQALGAGHRPPRMLLLAPTGKAAARLRESVAHTKLSLRCAPEVLAAIPDQASTIHRALGVEAHGTRLRHGPDNPLLADMVLVDEASMVDLALMARLFDAIPSHARVILLGDQDQLASVEAGAVLGDICNSGGRRDFSRSFLQGLAAAGVRLSGAARPPEATGIWDCIVQLKRSYRHISGSGIAELGQAVNAGEPSRVLDLLSGGGAELALRPLGRDGELGESLANAVRNGFGPSLRAVDPADRLRALASFRVLCAHRGGIHGVDSVNRRIEKLLADAGWIQRGETNYVGRPLLVTRNDYPLELFNGDVGVIVERDCLEDGSSARQAYFEDSHGHPRYLSPSRLPPHETVFAMTIHKSQGSELDEVAIILPDHPSPILSRELLYTAISRARRRVTIYGSPAVVAHAVEHRVERASGLRAALWGSGA